MTSSAVDVSGSAVPGAHVLSPAAIDFVAALNREFRPVRDTLMAERRARRERIAAAGQVVVPADTGDVREREWTVAPAPADLSRRWVEITGPTDRKMAINALNSGANVWLADLEDANTPHWTNVIGGQANLFDAVRRTIEYTSPDGRVYRLGDGPLATIVTRPRGWHLDERHVLVDGRPAVGALVDAGLYLFHNAAELLERGSGPYLYLPKLESHQEARLWNDTLGWIERELGLPANSVRPTVLIETITAAFEMDEILYELRDRVLGLNAGRWDYLFSIIKTFRDSGGAFTLPDRNQVTMTVPFMRAYCDLLVATCHRRGAFAMGGMAAFIPNRRDPVVTEHSLAKVRADKEREVAAGFDGSWVAHPELVGLCAEVFSSALGDAANQLERRRPDVAVSPADLLDLAATPGAITHAGLRTNVSVSIRYLAAWLGGHGAVAIDNQMEDAATAEISRSQVWQWIHGAARLEDGRPVTAALVTELCATELERIRAEVGPESFARAGYHEARDLFVSLALDDEFADFLTLPASALID